ncbi:unnamed protein product [Larinioides sclopetarius]|uniref:GTP-binding protein n=1 Tax=Larinioides sclopetarius TaxID=280406 RepID=A0AAV1YQD7_9ARAC
MDAYCEYIFISRREKKPQFEANLRKRIVTRKATRLRSEKIGVIGAETTGRNTLVRRFLNMSEAPFETPEDKRYKHRSVLVDLSERPAIRQDEIVKLEVYILNARARSYDEIGQFIPDLKTIAMIFDVTFERTVNIAISCMQRLRDQMHPPHPPFIMICNKIDLLRTRNACRDIRERARNSGAQQYYECSALMNMNMDSVLDAILLSTFFPGRSVSQ